MIAKPQQLHYNRVTTVLYYSHREFRWIGPYVIEKVLPNENYIVRKLNSQILHPIRLPKYTPNTKITDVRPEGNLQADDEIVIPQDDLYIISWEIEFDIFPSYSDLPHTLTGSAGDAAHPDTIITDLDHRSTRPDQNTNDAAEILMTLLLSSTETN